MKLDELGQHWNEYGKRDPLWAILTVPEKRNQEWDPEEFFRNGEQEIAEILAYIDSLKLSVPRGKALDFGCGVGRLTQALCRHFDECWGVDIAPSMIEAARKFNQYGERCHYIVNQQEHLQVFQADSFDFIYSVIVLQHIRPEYSRNYIREFLRILAPGGLLVFQIPSQPAAVQGRVDQVVAGAPLPSSAYKATVAETPLPSSAYKAMISTPRSIVIPRANFHQTVAVTVRNLSDVTWPAVGQADGRYQINLGNHWLDSKGNYLIFDDGRTPLPIDLRPREAIELSLVVTAPSLAGRYTLELDMVQEMAAWFKDKGSHTTQVEVQVKDIMPRIIRRFVNRYRRIKPSRFVPRMEMHGIHKEAVLALIAEEGGTVVDIREDKWAGEAWESYRYCVAKDTLDPELASK